MFSTEQLLSEVHRLSGQRAFSRFSMLTFFTANPGGVMVITQLDPNAHTIQGTFNFTGQLGDQTAIITEGSFSGRYEAMAGNGS